VSWRARIVCGGVLDSGGLSQPFKKQGGEWSVVLRQIPVCGAFKAAALSETVRWLDLDLLSSAFHRLPTR
jgi:hypothetical protein